MSEKRLKLILNLHDGNAAGAAEGTAQGSASESSTASTSAIRPEVKAKAAKLGISDDLLSDYQAAVDSKTKGKNSAKETSETDEAKETSESKNSDAQTAEKTAESEFDELISGKYKDAYKAKMQAAFADRFSAKDKQIAEMQKQSAIDNQIFDIIRNKYPGIGNDREALLKAVQGDNDLFTDTALKKGVTAEEARNEFFRQRQSDAQTKELETLRREKAASRLDGHLRSLAAQTQKEFPKFDLESEFANPAFRSALNFIAQQNDEQNKRSGKHNEIYDLTQAYKMAHWDELQNDLVKRAGSAAISAAAQSIQAGSKRPNENASGKRGSTSATKSVSEMSDAEFEALYEKVMSGKAKIPR